jgi:hypothetical protein
MAISAQDSVKDPNNRCPPRRTVADHPLRHRFDTTIFDPPGDLRASHKRPQKRLMQDHPTTECVVSLTFRCLSSSEISALLLLRLLSLSLSLSSLLSCTLVPLISPRSPQLHIRILGSGTNITLLDLADTMLNTGANLDRQGSADGLDDLVGVGCRLDVLLGRVELLVLAGLEREEDEAGLVGLQTLDVELEGLFGGGLAAVVDGDADCWGELAGDAGGLCSNFC